MNERGPGEVIRAFLDAFSSGDEASLRGLLAPEFRDVGPGVVEPLDTDTFLQGSLAFRAAFDDFKMVVQEQFVEGERVATRLVWSGVHSGDFHGLAPTGNTVRVAGVAIDTVRDGRVVEHWFLNDTTAMMTQLGVG